MANPEHLQIVKQGAEAITNWWISNQNGRFDLAGADLHGANLHGADLWGADLHGANLQRANLQSAQLPDANLRDTDLQWANLCWTDLRRADLNNAWLLNAIFHRSPLREADFSNCKCQGTVFSSVDLSMARGLDSVSHQGASEIGIETLYMSQGKIPEVFLRGCGVPDALIANLPALIGAQEPIQFYSCFISYSHADEAFAQRLHSGLQQKGLRVWYAPEDMQMGKKVYEQIESAIRVHDKLLLVLSEASMNSEWVKTEIAHARQREVTEGKRVLFPISLVPFDAIRAWKAFDADTGKDTAREIREYLVGDFSNWKDHDSFEKGFERLLRDLRAEGAKESGA